MRGGKRTITAAAPSSALRTDDNLGWASHEMRNAFDDSATLAVNALAGQSKLFDVAVGFISTNNLFQGVVFVGVLCWYWFDRTDAAQTERRREHVIASLVAGSVGLAIARGLALTLPFRLRPRFDPALSFRIPSYPDLRLLDWSAFPSDHAVLFAALATGIGFISRRAGIMAFGYLVLCVAFPLLYLGIHFPSDLICGTLLGAVIGIACNSHLLRRRIAQPAIRWERRAPGSFYVGFFLVSTQLATMFESVREAAALGATAVRRMLG